VAFLISDFCLPGDFEDSLQGLKPKLQITNKHHDLIAVSINDPRERELPNIGLLTIEDSETGEQVELDTANDEIRNGFTVLADKPPQRTEAVDPIIWGRPVRTLH